MSTTYSVFYDLPKLEQVAVNLFYGWGYNFYRLENQVRADDLMVRSHLSMLLNFAREALETQQSAYRRKFLPPPSREKPRPDPECIEKAQTLEVMSGLVGTLEGRIRALPVPENDRMTQRYRQEAETLLALRNCDTQMIGRADLLRDMMQDKTYDEILAHEADFRAAIIALNHNLQDRQRLLQ